MQTNTQQQALAQYALRLGGRLQDLDERIAALAQALGARLEQREELQHWLENPPAHAHQGTRYTRLRGELRGLLVLRYRMIARYCSELGVPLTLQLVCYAEEQLQARGWSPGVDGMDWAIPQRMA